ncbi:unnamed protein product [Sympodiomycopsis kandeliae]
MADAIDLTSESPPRTHLTLPGAGRAYQSPSHRYAHAEAGPSTSSSSSSSVPAVAQGSGRNTRQTARQRASQGGNSSSATRSGLDPFESPSTSGRRNVLLPSERRHPPPAAAAPDADSQEDDGIVMTGMSEGARLASEAARADVEAARNWRRDFLAHHAARRTRGANQTGAQRGGQNGLEIHDTLAPGPHHAVDPQSGVAFPAVAAPSNNNTGPRVSTTTSSALDLMQFLPSFRGNRLSFMELMTRLRGEAVEAAERAAGPVVQVPLLPENHDPKFVLNRTKPQPDQTNFTYGIHEPPVDVETYDQDPRIITGPLPDSSAICAGCDCALVRGGLGKRKLWALPCGHVVDGRCFDRYCAGISAVKTRRLAKQDIAEEEKTALAAVVPSEAPAIRSTATPMVRSSITAAEQEQQSQEAIAAGTKRLASQMEFNGADDSSKLDNDPRKVSRLEAPAPPQRSSLPPRDVTATDSQPRAPTTPAAAQPERERLVVIDDPLGTKANSTKTSNIKVQKFTCPVDGCNQRISTASGKPASAIELYL